MLNRVRHSVFRAARFGRAAASVLTALSLLAACAGGARAQRAWVRQGPGPTTGGQVEGIADGEVAGAVQTLAAHPTDAHVVYVGAVNGGIWRTNNARSPRPTWVEQLGPDRPLSIGDIAFDPTDATHRTLMAGSGRFSNYSYTPGGDLVGVWHTTDGGANWNLLDGGGAVAGLNISGVAPRGGTLVFAASATSSPTDNTGIWRRADARAAWTRVSGAPLPPGARGTPLPAGRSYDLAGDPSDHRRLYTNAGARGIYRSEDTGETWKKVSDRVLDRVLSQGADNVKIAVGARGNVYVAVVRDLAPGQPRPDCQVTGLFRSANGSPPWTPLDIPATNEGGTSVGLHFGGQGCANLSIAADRANPDVVYLGGDHQPHPFPNSVGATDYTGRLFRVDASKRRGRQVSHITHSNTRGNSAPHADSRDMAIDADNALLEADDGGVYRRTRPLDNTGDWVSINGDLAVTELHDVAWDSRVKRVIGGAQDTGTAEQETSGDVRWRSVEVGDGGDVAVDDKSSTDTSVRYHSSGRGFEDFLKRTFKWATDEVDEHHPPLNVLQGGAALRPQFTTPVVLNGVKPERLIIGGSNSVYESLDEGDSVTEIGPGIVVNADGAEPVAYGAAGNEHMLYVGAGDQVFVRKAAHPDPLTASATYPGAGTRRVVTAIVMNPADPETAFVTDTSRVYRTPDAGLTWQELTANLASLARGELVCVAYSTSNRDGSLIVGATNGVFVARGPAFDRWEPLGAGLPRAPVFDLEYDAADDILVAGLMGRGAWTLDLKEREPVDVALSLDLSGGMLSPACPDCPPKPHALKDSVELFVRLWSALALPEDRLGVNYGGEAARPTDARAADGFILGADMKRTRSTITAACLTALALAWLPLCPPRASAQDGDTSDGVELRPGLLIHPTLDVAYVMTPEGVAAVDIATGDKLWTTSAAAKPLTLAGRLLVSQAEQKAASNRLELVALDTRGRGTPSVRGVTRLPAGVKVTVGESPDGKFELEAEPARGAVNLAWEYRPPPSRVRQVRPGVQRGGAKSGTDDLLLTRRESEADAEGGALRMSLNTGAVTRQRVSPAPSLLHQLKKSSPRWILPGDEKLAAGPAATQYESADGRHVMASEQVAADRVWDKYRWTVYERDTGRRLGEIRTHLSFNPFVVRGPLLIFETTPLRRAGGPPEPAKLRAYSLSTGREVWSVVVRENVYRGPFPP